MTRRSTSCRYAIICARPASVFGKFCAGSADRAAIRSASDAPAMPWASRIVSISPLDALDLRQPECVDLLRRQLCRRVRLQRRGVDLVAVGNAPDAGVVHGFGPHGFKRRDHRLVAGDHFRGDELLRAVDERLTLRGRERLNLPELRRQRRDEWILLRAARDEGTHADERLVDHEVRRHDAMGAVVLDPDPGFAQHPPEFAQAREIAFDAASVLDHVGVREEPRGVYRDARDLVDAVTGVLEFSLPDQVVEKPGRRLPGDQFLPGETFRTVLVETGSC